MHGNSAFVADMHTLCHLYIATVALKGGRLTHIEATEWLRICGS